MRRFASNPSRAVGWGTAHQAFPAEGIASFEGAPDCGVESIIEQTRVDINVTYRLELLRKGRRRGAAVKAILGRQLRSAPRGWR